jgi:hypothetical protein
MRQSPKIIKKNREDLDRAINDFAAGKDVSWARTGATAKIQRIAVYADRVAGRDLTWARTSKLSKVRRSVAHADFEAGFDLTWAKDDSACGVRHYYEIQRSKNYPSNKN